tara:strand:- start:811 stop:1047 length:237 start_codon:yes stop_codon:yes gene_type:complete
MSTNCESDRFAKLRSLREKLCKQETNWSDAFKARDWLVDQLRWLHKIGLKPETKKEDVLERIEDILCVLDPGYGGDDE